MASFTLSKVCWSTPTSCLAKSRFKPSISDESVAVISAGYSTSTEGGSCTDEGTARSVSAPDTLSGSESSSSAGEMNIPIPMQFVELLACREKFDLLQTDPYDDLMSHQLQISHTGLIRQQDATAVPLASSPASSESGVRGWSTKYVVCAR